MKKLIPLLLLMFISNGVADDFYGKFYGQFSCDVDSSRLNASEEGQVSAAGGYADSFNVGDKVTITYYIKNNQLSTNGQLSLHVKNEVNGKRGQAWGSGEDIDESPYYPGDRVEMVRKDISVHYGIALGHNRISANNSKTLDMYRYFKNDWAAVFNEVRFYPNKKQHYIETVTFSCYHSRDRVDEVADELKRLW